MHQRSWALMLNSDIIVILAFMINRTLIRLKVVQLVYAYYQNEGKSTEVALAELNFSLEQAYKLYCTHLLLLVEIHRMALRRVEQRLVRKTSLGLGMEDQALARNRFLLQLAENKALLNVESKDKVNWMQDDNVVRKYYDLFCKDEVFLDYLQKGDYTYEADRELLRKLYKKHIEKNEDLEEFLEDKNLYWNDDKQVIDSFVLKTIKRFEESQGAEQELLPRYASKEDHEFATALFLNCLKQGENYRQRMARNTKNWDFSRLALMDIIIMQVALAEIANFATIPLSVSFNEYLDIAKYYSTPRSSSYIHGMLDTMVKQLRAEGIIFK